MSKQFLNGITVIGDAIVPVATLATHAVNYGQLRTVPTVSIARNADTSVNTLTAYGLTYTFTYNADGTVNTINDGAITRTLTWTNGEVTAIT